MLHSQQVIERSVYFAILNVLLQKGLTLNPENYLPLDEEKSNQYKADRAEIVATEGKKYIELYGVSDSLSKGMKYAPRIVISSNGFFPGDIGFDKHNLEPDEEDGFLVTEMPFEAIDQAIDIILVANNTEETRLLHSIINTAIPQRGYIKPYIYQDRPFSGNIFIVLSNFFKQDDNEKGLIERVYQFTIKDTLLEEPIEVGTLSPLSDISFLISDNTELNIN